MSSPAVGVGVLIFREGKLLLGRRKGSHGEGCWATPGGHLEFGESIEACARREVLEETGLTLSAVCHGPFTSDIFSERQKHYVTLFTIAHSPCGEPELCEPDKCEGWQWFAPDSLPQPLFAPLETLLKQLDNKPLSSLMTPSEL